jgi:hypothetical protein
MEQSMWFHVPPQFCGKVSYPAGHPFCTNTVVVFLQKFDTFIFEPRWQGKSIFFCIVTEILNVFA